jgi:hypothetical protein
MKSLRWWMIDVDIRCDRRRADAGLPAGNDSLNN